MKECRKGLDDFPGARAECVGNLLAGRFCNDCPDAPDSKERLAINLHTSSVRVAELEAELAEVREKVELLRTIINASGDCHPECDRYGHHTDCKGYAFMEIAEGVMKKEADRREAAERELAEARRERNDERIVLLRRIEAAERRYADMAKRGTWKEAQEYSEFWRLVAEKTMRELAEAHARANHWTDEAAKFCERATVAERQLAEARERIAAADRLLWRYRNETPSGHSPHMICDEVDAYFARYARSRQGLT